MTAHHNQATTAACVCGAPLTWSCPACGSLHCAPETYWDAEAKDFKSHDRCYECREGKAPVAVATGQKETATKLHAQQMQLFVGIP